MKRQTDGKNKNGYVKISHMVCTVFQSSTVVRLRQTYRAVEPSVVAVSIEN